MKNLKQLFRQTFSTILMLMAFCTTMQGQGISVKGTVTDGTADPLIGATIKVKGNNSLGTVTDFDGNFQLNVPSESSVLVISYVGMTTKEIKVGKQRTLKVTLQDDTQLEEVVVVGYGQQKKASVVGAITQTTGEVLERAAGIGSVGAALTGNLPGVATIASTGQPGEEDPAIYIRGAAAWNQDAQPLILVDGVKREIKSVDITSVATVSVLKDASATAVYGVEGANGVILITTKRGQEGKARIDVGFNATLKAVSKLPRKYDSYDGYMYRNQAIEHELAIGGDASWAFYRPQSFINLFRNQDTTVKPNFSADGAYLGDYSQAERYANVDWQDEMFKSTALSYNTNINFSGGTKFVKYFVAFDYQNEGALLTQCYSMRGLNAVAGVNIANTINNLFKVVFLAFGVSIGIIVGRLLGAGELEEAKETDRKIIIISVVISCFVGLVMLAVSPFFPKLYKTNDIARHIATSLIMVQAVCIPLEAFKNATYFTLRSGGRTFLTFLFDGFFVIAVSFPIAYFMSRYTDASVVWILISVHIGDLVKAIFGFILVKKGVWVRNIVAQ